MSFWFHGGVRSISTKITSYRAPRFCDAQWTNCVFVWRNVRICGSAQWRVVCSICTWCERLDVTSACHNLFYFLCILQSKDDDRTPIDRGLGRPSIWTDFGTFLGRPSVSLNTNPLHTVVQRRGIRSSLGGEALFRRCVRISGVTGGSKGSFSIQRAT